MKNAHQSVNGGFAEVHLFQMLQEFPQGIMVAKQDTTSFVFTNHRMQQLLGYGAEELIGKTPAFVHPEDEMERVMMSFQAMLSGQMQAVKAIRFKKKNGKIFTCDIQAHLLKTPEGNFICGYFQPSEPNSSNTNETNESHLLQQRLDAAQDVGKMGFWTLFHTNSLLEWSDNAYRIYGYEPRSFQPTLDKLLQSVHAEDRPMVESSFQKHLDDKSSFDLVHRLQTADGSVKYLRERCISSYDEAGKAIYSFGTVVDVTKLELSRLEAVSHLRQLEEILFNNRSFTWEVTPAGELCNLSTSASSLLGYVKEELIGKPLYVLLDAEHIDIAAMQAVVGINGAEKVLDQYIPIKTKAGESIWFSVSAKMKRNEQGLYDGFLGSATDISNRKKIEDELIASESKFRSIAETLPGAVWMSNPGFTLHYVSQGITPLLGYSAEAFMALPLQKFIQSDSLDIVERSLQELKSILENGELVPKQHLNLEVEMICSDGKLKWVQMVITPLISATNSVDGFMGVIRDISELKEREESLQKLNAVLEEGGRLAKMGTWELDLTNGQLFWGKVTRELHEVDDDFVPSLDNALDFYVPAFRDQLLDKVNEISVKGGEYDLELQIQTAKSRIRWVRTMGKSQIKNGQCIRLWGVIQDIHDIKQQALELARERLRMKNVLTATKVATWFWNVQTGETVFNERWAEMLGRRLSDLEPTSIKNWEELCHPDDLAIAEKKLDAYFAGKTSLYETEFRMLHNDGHWVWIRDVGSVIEWTPDGKPLAMYGTHEDISEAIIAEEALRTAEEKYRIIAQNNFNWEFWLGTDGRFIYHSPAVERITGYSVDVLTDTEKILELIHPDDRAYYHAHHLEVSCGKHAGEINFRIIDRSGAVHFIEQVCQPIFSADGKDLGIRGTNIDITDKYLASVQIRKLLQAVEQSQASIVITNLEGIIEYVNPFFTKMTGYSLEEAKGKNPRILSTGHTSKEEYKVMFERLQRGETWQGEFLNRKKNGDLYWEFATISPIKNEAGIIENYVAIKEDITDRKELSDSLKTSELKYRLIAENASDVIWVYNFTNPKFTYISPSIEQLRGFTVEEALAQQIESTMGEDALEMFMDGTYEQIKEFMLGHIDGIPPMVVELKQPHKAGHWIWAEVSMRFHKNEQDEVEVIGVSRNIQERKQAEALREKMQNELAESEARFKTLFYGNASIMYLVDVETGQLVDANNAALAFYGFSREQFTSRKISEISANPAFWQMKLEHLQKNGSGRFEFQHQRADGTLADVEIFSCLIEINGQLLVHDIVHNISDRNSYLREVERQNDALKEIAWTQSHVVRAPLARIMSLLELLDVEHASIYSETLILDSIKNSAKELDALVHLITERTRDIKRVS